VASDVTDSGDEPTIPVEKWTLWPVSDHPDLDSLPMYRSDLTPEQQQEFDEKMLARAQGRVVYDPYAALRVEIEEIAQSGDDFSPEVRIQQLQAWRSDVTDLLGLIDTYIGDLKLIEGG
jgi:hypothetical protein